MFERLLSSLSSFQVMFVGPEIASRLRRHSAELSEAIARSRPPRDESGDLQEVVSVGGAVRLQSPYWWVFFSISIQVLVSGPSSWKPRTATLL